MPVTVAPRIVNHISSENDYSCLAPPHIKARSSCPQEVSGSGSNTDFILVVAA